jgi:hypothetical protein
VETQFDSAYLPTAAGVARSAPFPFDQVCEALDGAGERVGERDNEALAAALRAVVVWLCEGRERGQVTAEEIGRRCAALGYLVTPEVFEGKSLNRLAKQLGASLSDMSRHSADARRRFGLVGNAFSGHSRHLFKSSK